MSEQDSIRPGILASTLETAGIYAVAAVLLALGMVVSPDFLTGENLLNTLASVALLGMVAAGMAFVTYSGNMADLSLPSIMAFSGWVSGRFRWWSWSCCSCFPLPSSL